MTDDSLQPDSIQLSGQTLLDQPDQSDQPDQPNDLMLALDRLFHIGSFYPTGHSRCQEVAAEFHEELASALADHSTLVLDIGREALLLQGQLLNATERGVKRVHEILTSLGVARIEIEGSATTAELLDFVSEVFGCRWRDVAVAACGEQVS